MRLIGHLTEEQAARTFGDYLYVQGIANQLEHEKHQGWGVWISDEDQIGRASGLLEEFRKNPGDSKYLEPAKSARMDDPRSIPLKLGAIRVLFFREMSSAGIARLLSKRGKGATFVGLHLLARFPAGCGQLCAFGKIAILHRPVPKVWKSSVLTSVFPRGPAHGRSGDQKGRGVQP
jgi:hypothetical protein